MKLHTLYIYIVTTILSLSACSTNSVVEEIPDTPQPSPTESTDLLLFTGASEEMTSSTRAVTRASSMLRNGFLVSTYKAFGTKVQQSVMDKYIVEYKENRDDWNGVVVSNWNYIGTYNSVEQKEKYWDYANFPYRFHAIAPKVSSASIPTFPTNTKLGNDELSIQATYKAQAFEASNSNDISVTPSDADAEPYLVAQVHRDNNGKDFDILKGRKEINESSDTKSRRVALPFHHLNCKVRFGVYTDNLFQTSTNSYIKDLTIKVEKLATDASGFEAYGTDSWSSETGFSNFTGINIKDNQTIFRYNCNASDKTYESNDLSMHQSKSTAYWLECPDGIMQLPQTSLKIHVSMTVVQSNSKENIFFDYEIIKENNEGDHPEVDPTHWIAGNIHSYYLRLSFDDQQLPIMTVTCTLSDWTDISGSLSTDLEQ